MYSKILCIIHLVLILSTAFLNAQQPTDEQELYNTLKSNDSLLFDRGFNHCEMEYFRDLLAEDMEFYHDKSGIMDSKAYFVENFQNNICGGAAKIRRELVAESLAIFPLFNNGVLYGALQNGEHRFHEQPAGAAELLTSIARFSHLWLLEGDKWQLSRIISYDHLSP